MSIDANETVKKWPGVVARHPMITGSKAKLVSLILATEAGWSSGIVSLHVNRVARLADVEPEFVRDIVGALVALGLLVDTGRTDKRGRWLYELAVPAKTAA